MKNRNALLHQLVIRKKRRILKIVPIGGIGNQLFIYFAGKYLADKYKKELVIDLSQVHRLGTKHIGDISSLSLPGRFIHANDIDSNVPRIFERVNSKLCRESSLYRRAQLVFFGRFHASDLGFEQELLNSKLVSQITGYFQTWIYFEKYHPSRTEYFKLQHPSEWFKDQVSKIQREKPIGLHIRRGDYSALQNEFGLLSTSYYIQGLRVLERTHPGRKIWIFSDDVSAAREILTGIEESRLNFVESPRSAEPIESLILMSLCEALIIANSTFSYWAAIVGESNRTVIAPQKWFKGRSDPNKLMPKSWIKIESQWVRLENQL
jgi:hypothetical protein